MIKTKFGNAKIYKDGYYRITSGKEGNNLKYLHRLVWEDWYNKPVPKGYDIHHINGDKTDNRIQNLQCVEHSAHVRFHKKRENHHSEETKLKMSKAKNTSGYYRVIKHKDPRFKQGFVWRYWYYVDGKRKSINSTDIDKLEEKVRARGLEWMELVLDDDDFVIGFMQNTTN